MWRARNNEASHGNSWPSFLVAHFARIVADETSRCLSQHSSAFNCPSTDVWEPSTDGFRKVNVDDSVLWDRNRAGFGVIIRNATSEGMAAWSGGSQVLRVLHVELLAIKWGLKLVWGRGLRSVVCETDCLEAFHWSRGLLSLLSIWMRSCFWRSRSLFLSLGVCSSRWSFVMLIVELTAWPRGVLWRVRTYK